MEPRQRVYELLNKFKTAMFITTSTSDQPEARPMQIAKVEDGGDIYFFTGRSGRVAGEIGHETLVLLVMQDEMSAYLSLRGKARIVIDRAKIKELFSEPYKVWFPGGVDDPELLLLAVDPESAEYWDNRGINKLEYMFEAAKAYIKGERPAVDDAGQHAKTNM
jgi:general stress protein 26